MAVAIKTCKHCKKEYTIKDSPVNIRKSKFCSRACSYDSMRCIPEFEDRMRERLKERSSLQENGCVLYTGQNNGVYGQIEYRRRTYLVHRVSYAINKGEIPPGMCVCHSCDTPLCINPQHLWLGTYADNNADRVAKGRSRYNPRRKLTTEQVSAIRNKISAGAKYKAIAIEFGVSESYISMLKNYSRRKL